MSNCPPFLNADTEAGNSQNNCEYIKLFLSRIALTSEIAAPFNLGYLNANHDLFPDIEPYHYTLRKLRDGHIYSLYGDQLLRTPCKNGLIDGLEYFRVLPTVKKFWIVFSDVKWTDEIKEKIKSNPDKWMQSISLEMGQKYVTVPYYISTFVEEYRERTGHLMSIRGLDRQLRESLSTEKHYTDDTFPVINPEDQYLVRRWLDSYSKITFLTPEDRKKRCEFFNAEIKFLVALHDPMGISLDFGQLSRVSVETMTSYNRWYGYPTSMASYIAVAEHALDEELHDSTENWHTRWITRKYLGPALDGTPKETPCPYNERVPRATATTRWVTMPSVGSDPDDKDTNKYGWWLVQQYYNPEKPLRMPRHLLQGRMFTFLQTRQRDSKAFLDGFTKLDGSWKKWLSYKGDWGVAHPFEFFSQKDEDFPEYEKFLALCLNSVTHTETGIKLAVSCILDTSTGIRDLVWNAAKGGQNECKINDYSSDVLDALSEALPVVHRRNKGEFNLFINSFKKRLDKEDEIKDLPTVDPVVALCAVTELMIQKAATGAEPYDDTRNKSANISGKPSDADIWDGRPTSGRITIWAARNEQISTLMNLGHELCGGEMITLCHAVHTKNPRFAKRHIAAGKFLLVISKPLSLISWGIYSARGISDPSATSILGMIRATYSTVKLFKPVCRIASLDKMVENALDTGLKQFGPKALAAKGAFWRAGPLTLVIDASIMTDLISEGEDNAAIAHGLTIAGYMAAAALMGPGAPAAATILLIQFIGIVLVEYLKSSEVEKWIKHSYWGKKYSSPLEDVYDNFKQVYPLFSYQEKADSLVLPPSQENIHPALVEMVTQESKAQQIAWLQTVCKPRLCMVAFMTTMYIRLEAKQFIPWVSEQTIEVTINGQQPWPEKTPEVCKASVNEGSSYWGKIDPSNIYPKKPLVLIPWMPRYDLKNGAICWELVLNKHELHRRYPSVSSRHGSEIEVTATYTYNSETTFPVMKAYADTHEWPNRNDGSDLAVARIRLLMNENPKYAKNPTLKKEAQLISELFK